MTFKEIPLDTDNIVRLYQSGISEQAIARKIGVSRSVVKRRLEVAGIERRGRSTAAINRFSTSSLEERRIVTAAAISVRRGQVDSDEVRERRSMNQRADRVGMFESEIIENLASMGVACNGQFPVGPYNVDLTIAGTTVAVEIYSTHPSKDRMTRLHQRAKDILNYGYSMLVVQITYPNRIFDITAVCEKIISFRDFVSSNQSSVGHYGVIRGNGKIATTTSHKLNDHPLVITF
ncbi:MULTISPECIES: helix-turn-helix domain-containing protein [Enterobacteriaceae]|uniref:helix-turn-helix domain-containing protein n=1 Tax=Enterobacteriaceae TaxID=543 RepID=UPI00350EBFA9